MTLTIYKSYNNTRYTKIGVLENQTQENIKELIERFYLSYMNSVGLCDYKTTVNAKNIIVEYKSACMFFKPLYIKIAY